MKKPALNSELCVATTAGLNSGVVWAPKLLPITVVASGTWKQMAHFWGILQANTHCQVPFCLVWENQGLQADPQ